MTGPTASQVRAAATAAGRPPRAEEEHSGHGFGTLPVFLAGISTILGAILFLRFGYAVGHTGLMGAIGVILAGHLVTVPTALAIAEISTNRKVEGGGEYFIISRSFGTTIGSVIGISLYASQAISVGFYMIAFAEAFRPIQPMIEEFIGVPFDPRMVSIPSTLLLGALVLLRGADLGVRVLYVVAATLAASLLAFFLGHPIEGFDPGGVRIADRVAGADPFFVVFAICFPAFTGMTAGVGLSGDLRNPRRSIPLGTIVATGVGMITYLAIAVKLALSAPAEALAEDQLIMSRIALWGPIIPIGLAAATLSSAIGSILVAPRTLQALGGDGAVPIKAVNRRLAQGVGEANEPRNATLVTLMVAVALCVLGDVNLVARLISMFFMVTYGSLCLISALEHFAARPSYRPAFRSRWYISLFGAAACLFMMFQMDPLFALLALALMVALYRVIRRTRAGRTDDLAEMFAGVFTQATRYMQISLQRRRERRTRGEWRPSVLLVSERSFERRAPLEFLSWLCHRQGFGTHLHFVKGRLDRQSHLESQRVKEKLIRQARRQQSTVYMDTIVSPSLASAIAQSVQIPGVSGVGNNALLMELSVHDPDEAAQEIASACGFALATRMSLLVLRDGDHFFGDRRSIHIWLTWNDRHNAGLMILLGYILLGHPDWVDAEISVFAALPREQLAERRAELLDLILTGRIPISRKNVRFLPVDDVEAYGKVVARASSEADLTILGFDPQGLEERGARVFRNHPGLRDALFVYAAEEIELD